MKRSRVILNTYPLHPHIEPQVLMTPNTPNTTRKIGIYLWMGQASRFIAPVKQNVFQQENGKCNMYKVHKCA